MRSYEHVYIRPQLYFVVANKDENENFEIIYDNIIPINIRVQMLRFTNYNKHCKKKSFSN